MDYLYEIDDSSAYLLLLRVHLPLEHRQDLIEHWIQIICKFFHDPGLELMVLGNEREYHLSYSLIELLEIGSMQQDQSVIVPSSRVVLHLQSVVMSDLHNLSEGGLLVSRLEEKLNGLTLGLNHQR